VRALALDYGAARTGVAVSDATGTLARPLGVVERASSEAGLLRVAELVAEHDAEVVVVGMPLTLRGEHGAQARETEVFVAALRGRLVAFLRERKAITTQEFKELVGATRKHVIPLAEHFDKEKLTLRVGEKRLLRGEGRP